MSVTCAQAGVIRNIVNGGHGVTPFMVPSDVTFGTAVSITQALFYEAMAEVENV